MIPSNSDQSTSADVEKRKGRIGKRKNDETNPIDDGRVSYETSELEKANEKSSQNFSNAPPRASGLASIQSIFAKRVRNIPSIKQEVDRIQQTLKKNYKEILRDYNETAAKEIENDFEKWRAVPVKPNYYRKNLEDQIGNVRNIKLDEFPIKISRCQNSRALCPKPSRNENGTVQLKKNVPCVGIEVGDILPRMNYWVSMEQSTVSDDQLRLSHMPFIEKRVDEQALHDALNEKFPDGIHGCKDNWTYINDWLLYKLFSKSLLDFKGTPDAFYYAVYCLWPNKLSQRQLSSAFPDWCNLYAESRFDWHKLEHWKNENGLEAAINIQKPFCHSCLTYTCVIHGFKAEIPTVLPAGSYFSAMLTLPNMFDKTINRCSKKCWLDVKRMEYENTLALTFQDIDAKRIEVCLDKLKILKMTKQEGAAIASSFIFNHELPFCEFAKQAIDPNYKENPEMNTCAGAYRIILKCAQKLTKRRFNLGVCPPKLKQSELAQLFRNTVKKNRTCPGESHTADVSETKKKDGVAYIKPAAPIVACRHSGSCATTEEYCSCRKNGFCSYLCECDITCPQRFPGCKCTTGQCHSKSCQCYLANWECNPITCPSCSCDVMDEEGARCKNVAMTRAAQKRLIIAPSRISGNGLFILDPAEKDEFITEYVGERISDDEVERRGAIYDSIHCSYIFNLPTGEAIDSNNLGNMARFANHDANKPTVYARTLVVAGELRIGFYAKRKLAPGEELLFDYSYSKEHHEAINVQDEKNNGGKTLKKHSFGKTSTSSE